MDNICRGLSSLFSICKTTKTNCTYTFTALRIVSWIKQENRKTLVNSSHNPDCPFDDFV